jgi:uncharacterized Zn finger protein (UPF0148 family)
MNIAGDDKQAPRCPTCGMTKMIADGKWQCPNCSTNEPKTGHTILITEPQGKDGPVKIQRVQAGDVATPDCGPSNVGLQPQFTPEQVEQEIQKRTNTVLLHVPTSLFPDLVMWCRKLKLPKDWKEAEKIKAITDFQVEINKKLENLQ